MTVQVLSDLHLETEHFAPTPAPAADLLVLAGDVDSSWQGLSRFANWPVPVLFVPGNHEFDGRDVDEALVGLRARSAQLGLTLLERETLFVNAPDGRVIRILGTTRWCDFDLFGEAQRAKAMRAAHYFVKVMRATRACRPFDPEAVRAEALRCRQWLADTLAMTPHAEQHWDATVVITHFGPSLRSADPRYGRQPGTASFCNADDALMPGVDLWIHGHLHCRHDYLVRHETGVTRVVSNARGHGHKGESSGYDGSCCVRV
ncbi:MAG: metallophosphoesterase [Aquabacterium sp.]|nr:metallophosphoesterase [Aquabacterium sp.]MBP7133324.1 metallophosphoesterase [Aquabacterium sp.]